MQLVRVRSKDGLFRIQVDAGDDARVLVDRVRAATHADPRIAPRRGARVPDALE